MNQLPISMTQNSVRPEPVEGRELRTVDRSCQTSFGSGQSAQEERSKGIQDERR